MKNIKTYMGCSGKLWQLEQNSGSSIFNLLIERRKIKQEKIEDLLRDAHDIPGLQESVLLTVSEILKKKKIGLLGDYDMDGCSSVSIMKLFFKEINIETFFIVPNRFSDGYGPSINLIDRMKAESVDLLFMMDCGSSSIEEIKYAKSMGIKTIVIDHHFLKDRPVADAILNPQINNHEMSYLCSAGLTFVFLWYLRGALEEKEIILERSFLIKLLELVALGTVCDMVPLVGLNRQLVSKGLQVANKPGSLLSRFFPELEVKIDESQLGFFIGPRINSLGRFGMAEIAVHAFTNLELIDELIKKMNVINASRRNIERTISEKCLFFLENKKENVFEDENLIIISGEGKDGFFAPILGIAAGKIKDMKNKSVFLISWVGNIGKGSSRGINNFHIGDSLIKAKEKDIIKEGGGHKQAGGFTLERQKLPEFISHLCSGILKVDSTAHHTIDLVLSVSGIGKELINTMDQISPFGQSNPFINFLIPNVIIKKFYTAKSGCLLFKVFSLNEKIMLNGSCNNMQLIKNLNISLPKKLSIICQIQTSPVMVRVLDFVLI